MNKKELESVLEKVHDLEENYFNTHWRYVLGGLLCGYGLTHILLTLVQILS
jgi:hypothetical protein